MTILSDLLPDVLGRIEDPMPPGPIHWDLQGEVYVQMVYALFEAALVTGNVQKISVVVPLAANTTYFNVPQATIAPIRMRSPFPVKKTTLKALDDLNTGWQQQTGDDIKSWFPMGVNMFGIYPQLTGSISVTMDFIASPINEIRPYTGNETDPFQNEFNDILTTYTAAMLRAKEGGAEAEESDVVFQDYMAVLKRLSQFQQRIDSLVYSGAFGFREGVNPRTQV